MGRRTEEGRLDVCPLRGDHGSPFSGRGEEEREGKKKGARRGRSRMETDGQVSARKWAKLSELESIGVRGRV